MARRMLAPIISIKHYVQSTIATVTSGSTTLVTVVATHANTALPTATNSVQEGSIVKAIYIEFWLKGLGAADAATQFLFTIYKNPGGQNNLSNSDALNLMAYDNKKNVFFQSQGVIGGVGGGQSVPVIRQWLKIPKGKQRFGLNDKLQIGISAVGESISHCGFQTFKEYR